MKTRQSLSTILLAAMLFNPAAGRAEDIDLYSGLTGVAGRPNVLFVIDNAANFSSSAAGSTCIIDGVATALSGSVGGIEQCALYNVVSGLPTNDDGTARLNIGIMVYNSNNIRDVNNANCAGSAGGCLAQPLIPMDAANKTAFLAWLKSWTTTGGGGPGYIKASGEATAAALQEAWAYFKGETGISGRNYHDIQPAAGCQKNFVIFIGNSFSSAGTPGDGPSTAQTALEAASGVTAAQTAQILDTIKTDYTSTLGFKCGTGTFTFPSSAHETKGYYGDEWSRFMYQSDLYPDPVTDPPTPPVTQNIVTYSVGLLSASCQSEYAATLTNMARYGGGKYFPTNDYEGLKVSILKILNEVQAVNSVFASSSLPVSVNAQGTYLNQIYMGMFRPDASGLPRWVGNLKQYKFGFDGGDLKLVDATGAAAISGAGTGFISATAVSFWTTRDDTVEPDLNGGFWRNKPQSVGGGYDYPDGELVEKGGAAQVMRLSNLLNDYAANPRSPRKVYTWCPSGTSCVADLTHSSNAFASDNSGIPAGVFGAANVTVARLKRCVQTDADCTTVDPTTAVVTTNFDHGYVTGNVVSISGSNQPEYNVTQGITKINGTKFKITGLPDNPASPNTVEFSASLHGADEQAIESVSLATSTTANPNGCVSGIIPNINCNRVTVTVYNHGYDNGDPVKISGVVPPVYNGSFIIGNATTNTFTYDVPVTPVSPSVNAYSVQRTTPAPVTITSISKISGLYVVAANGHGFSNGQSVTISGNSNTDYNTTWTVFGAAANYFVIAAPGGTRSGSGGTVVLNPPVIAIPAGNISRASATSTTATVSGLPSGAFSNGQSVNLRYVSGSGTSETEYVPLSGTKQVTISCSSPCTSFTFPITTSTGTETTLTLSSAKAALLTTPVTIPAGAITRTGGITSDGKQLVTVTGVANTFVTGDVIDLSAPSAGAESAYVSPAAGWTISCDPIGGCSSWFTFGPVQLTPAPSATGSMTAFSGQAPPDKSILVNWLRGHDNFGDEPSPEPAQTHINIRPSLHGDVLHSRPTVINYGGTTGVVVYYGANDGVYRAVNGNQTAAIGSVPAGGELWSFIPPEFYGELTRLHDNSPVLKLATTPPGIVPAPRKKNYFVDGASSVYQKMNSSGGTDVAYLFLAMRRGGAFMMALDVSSPTSPSLLWKISPAGITNASGFTENTDFAELGQTWSQPSVTFVKGYCGGAACSSSSARTPVLIFGAGYDTSEDSEPPGADSMGRGIFIVDALTGQLVWRATYGATSGCSGTSVKATCTVAGMNYSIPADITLMDVSGNDGYIDRLYATDVGGNIWRVDLEPTAGNTPDNWKVTKLAALGCDTGACPAGTTPRKFLYPVDVINTGSYTAVFAGSGDREHPLYSAADGSSYNTTNRFYMVKDTNVGNNGSNLNITEANLKNITATSAPVTTTAYDGTLKGYYITLGTGEKVVNAPTTVAGYTYFGTSASATPTSNSCTTNLGIARGYQVRSLTGESHYVVYDGGGLPPTAVAGSVIVNKDGVDVLVPFCIGCGGDPDCVGADCKSASGGGEAKIKVATNRSRTYWYMEID